MPQTHAETPMEFIRTRPGVQAWVMRIGLNTTQVMLVAETGEWIRYVVPSLDAAREVCERLRLEFKEGIPDDLRMRMNNYQRSPEDWRDAPYPERSRGTSV